MLEQATAQLSLRVADGMKEPTRRWQGSVVLSSRFLTQPDDTVAEGCGIIAALGAL